MGIDEAGRGCVIGPLVMCGYLVDENKIWKLKDIGVKDSKLLSAKKRESLEGKLKKIADDFILLKVSAREIDKLRSVSNLNKLEIERMQHIIKLLQPDRAFVDAIEANEKKFHEKLTSRLNGTEVIAENFADKKYPVVGAASILAKVHRDAEIEKINQQYNLGSGYTSDPKTISFLKDWAKRNKDFPDFVRKSWITIKLILEEKEQKNMMDFVNGE
mgnify:CR=1 FL=1